MALYRNILTVGLLVVSISIYIHSLATFEKNNASHYNSHVYMYIAISDFENGCECICAKLLAM